MKKIVYLTSVLVFVLSTSLFALTGLDIVKKVDEQKQPKSSIAKMKMTLISKSGSQKTREVIVYLKDTKEGKKTLMKFLAPADIRSTGFLVWEHKDKDDDQFLYLPALKKVRRISSSQKNQSFLGTDFSYQDMESRDINKATHKLLREEKLNGYDCYVVESIPNPGEDYQYSKLVEWIRKDNYVPIKAEMYDKNGKLYKILTVQNVENIDGYQIVKKTTMENIRTKHKTILEIVNIKINPNLPDKYFTQRFLEKDL